MRRILMPAVLLLIILSLSACQLYNHDYKEDILEYAMIVTDGAELEILDQYPNLEYVDLRGSTSYDAILDYCASHPDVKVRFSIDLGQKHLNQDATEVILLGSDAVYEDLMSNLKYFRFLKYVHFEQISLTKSQFDALQNAYPQINFTYDVVICADSYDVTVTEANLSQLTSEDLNDTIASLEFLTNLTTVDLMDSKGTSKLTVADVRALMEAHPQINFNYQFDLFGQTLSTEMEKLEYKNVNIGDAGLEEIRNALAVMPRCTYVCLDNCGISNEAMDKFRSEFPNICVVWRVFVDRYSVLTDTEVILMRNNVSDSEAEALKYCSNVKYLDMTGCKIRDFSFIESMPNLECAVLNSTYVSDLTPFKNCKNLIWLDFANCTALSDLSPLSGLENLKNLNLSCTKVRDLSPLNSVPLERFKCVKPIFNAAELSNFRSKHPACLVTSTGNMIGIGWRYDDAAQKEPCEYYVTMKNVFGYAK